MLETGHWLSSKKVYYMVSMESKKNMCEWKEQNVLFTNDRTNKMGSI
jgi:hypothetical protein